MTARQIDLRAADIDRAFVAERLKAALDQGRLSLIEFDERLARVYSARTYGELDQVVVDLPGVASAGPTPAGSAPLGYAARRSSLLPWWAWVIVAVTVAVFVLLVLGMVVGLSAAPVAY